MKKFVVFLILFIVIQSLENQTNTTNSQNNILNNTNLNSNITLNNSHVTVNSTQQELNETNTNNTQQKQNITTNSSNINNTLNITNNNKTEEENKKCNKKIGPINIPEGAREKMASAFAHDSMHMISSGHAGMNLTEALFNFYNQNIKNGSNIPKTGDEKRDKIIEENMIKFKEQMEKQMKNQEIQRKANEHLESRRKAELIRLEAEKKEIQKQKEMEEREKFDEELINTTFSDNFNLYLDRGEKENIYLDLELDQNIVLAFFVSDQDEKIKFTVYGPDTRGKMVPMIKINKRNYFLMKYAANKKGEYIVEIWNTGTKKNEINFFINENVEKKGLLNVDKIDKISLLLKDIKKEVNKLKRKKMNEIMLVNAHNDKVNKNNKSIVVYSLIEIFTMIIIFVGQSYYIRSIAIKKL